MRLFNTFFKLSVILLLFVFLSSPLFCSETRVATLGQEGIFLKDVSNVMLFPGTLLHYKDLAITEMRSLYDNEVYTIGIHMGYNTMASGFYINQPINSSLLQAGIGEFSSNGITLGSELNNAYVFMFGMPLAGFDAGFGLMTAGTSQDNGTLEETATYFAVLAGVSNDRLDAGVKVELPSIEHNVDGGDKTEFSGFGLSAQGRYHLMTLSGSKIIPLAEFGMASAGYKNGQETDFSGTMFRAGVAVEKAINEDNLLVVGLEAFGYSSIEGNDKTAESKTTTTTTTLPGIYIGIESRMADWLIGRVGARHTNVSETTKVTDADDTVVDGSTFKVNLGLGMEFGNFLLDFAINEGIIFDGPNILSGQANNLSSRISITYDFGGENE